MAGDGAPRKRQRVSEHVDDDPKKQRGRPRVEGQDETAADRRRTQIRLAQRAYRMRKETTISSLKIQVSSLQSTIEEMNKTFLQFNDSAVASGILRMSPDLGQQLKAATEKFILLAKASSLSGDENSDSEIEEVPTSSKAARQQTSRSQREEPMVLDQHDGFPFPTISGSSTSPEPVSAPNRGIDIGMGYVQILDHEPIDSISVEDPLDTFNGMDTSIATDRYDSAMENFSLYPYSSNSSSTADLMAISAASDFSTQQYNGQVPSPPPMVVRSPTKSRTLPPPYTYSFQETTFARRLQRAAVERGFHLLSTAEVRPQAFNRVFRLSLLYHTRDTLLNKFRFALTRTASEPMETLQTPFIHLGNAGFHYNTGRIKNGYIVKPGPLGRQVRLESADSPGVNVDIDLDMTEYDGEWFDANDVEGYLEEKGITIDPQSTFAEANIELEGPQPPEQVFSPTSSATSRDHTATSGNTSPHTPVMSESALDLHTNRLFPELGGWETGSNSAWDNAATGWLMGSGDKTPDFLSSGWSNFEPSAPWDLTDTIGDHSFSGFGATDTALTGSVAIVAAPTPPLKKSVIVDVSKLIDDLIKKGICLGRAPGFRKRDVDMALTAAIVQVN
ncbi:hypothetical protein EJ08DRAFT_680003 [Tothia fuscella]|uniref:BZIP domain-containing protein n=1 Tax=Tothia fuscella TaxID=1048955 RepID=A0A9P4NQ67_9PEZI|nr:hypothetical protein EJ08DRAFT_680003 [Tothia fuscella]